MTLLVVFPVVPSIERFFAKSNGYGLILNLYYGHYFILICCVIHKALKWHFNYRHEYGLSPVWSRWWIFSLKPKANPFPHSSHMWDFSRGTGCIWGRYTKHFNFKKGVSSTMNVYKNFFTKIPSNHKKFSACQSFSMRSFFCWDLNLGPFVWIFLC